MSQRSSFQEAFLGRHLWSLAAFPQPLIPPHHQAGVSSASLPASCTLGMRCSTGCPGMRCSTECLVVYVWPRAILTCAWDPRAYFQSLACGGVSVGPQGDIGAGAPHFSPVCWRGKLGRQPDHLRGPQGAPTWCRGLYPTEVPRQQDRVLQGSAALPTSSPSFFFLFPSPHPLPTPSSPPSSIPSFSSFFLPFLPHPPSILPLPASSFPFRLPACVFPFSLCPSSLILVLF